MSYRTYLWSFPFCFTFNISFKFWKLLLLSESFFFLFHFLKLCLVFLEQCLGFWNCGLISKMYFFLNYLLSFLIVIGILNVFLLVWSELQGHRRKEQEKLSETEIGCKPVTWVALARVRIKARFSSSDSADRTVFGSLRKRVNCGCTSELPKAVIRRRAVLSTLRTQTDTSLF